MYLVTEPSTGTTARIKRILSVLDMDMFYESGKYTVRLWDNGEMVISVSDPHFENAVILANRNAQVYVNQC